MFCTHCGSSLRDGQKFCENCGAPVEQTQQQAQQTQQTAYQAPPPHAGPAQAAAPTFDAETCDAAILGCSFGLAVRRFFEKYVTFHGRASRSEYWWVFLLNWAIAIVASWLGKILPGAEVIVTLALFLPGLALFVRREQDIGRKWTRLFVAFIPFVGAILLFIDMVKPSEGANRFGPAPISMD